MGIDNQDVIATENKVITENLDAADMEAGKAVEAAIEAPVPPVEKAEEVFPLLKVQWGEDITLLADVSRSYIIQVVDGKLVIE